MISQEVLSGQQQATAQIHTLCSKWARPLLHDPTLPMLVNSQKACISLCRVYNKSTAYQPCYNRHSVSHIQPVHMALVAAEARPPAAHLDSSNDVAPQLAAYVCLHVTADHGVCRWCLPADGFQAVEQGGDGRPRGHEACQLGHSL